MLLFYKTSLSPPNKLARSCSLFSELSFKSYLSLSLVEVVVDLICILDKASNITSFSLDSINIVIIVRNLFGC